MSELVLDLWFLTIYPVGASADYCNKARFVLPRPFVDTNKQWSSALRFIFWLSSECFFSGNVLTLHEEWAHEAVLPLVRNREILRLHNRWSLQWVLNSQWSSWSQILVASSTTGVEHIVPAEVRFFQQLYVCYASILTHTPQFMVSLYTIRSLLDQQCAIRWMHHENTRRDSLLDLLNDWLAHGVRKCTLLGVNVDLRNRKIGRGSNRPRRQARWSPPLVGTEPPQFTTVGQEYFTHP
ncbi:hypothetical protein PROFUN_16255 [Planoprotostelium fungivorum]|uniref:Uncharacterized protein n=1 Tax=Planoprotostelium fungivorum TaxID=1890364 RepID=A0A2P6MRM6_9EUKA|nr:hypothetical protein PROFUN_16255 [Planoprotostelium fungivorum]